MNKSPLILTVVFALTGAIFIGGLGYYFEKPSRAAGTANVEASRSSLVVSDNSSTKEVKIVPVNFISEDELSAFLKNTPVEIYEYGTASLEPKCGDWAISLQNQAALQGYIINIITVDGPYRNPDDTVEITVGVVHAMCSALVNRDIYWIEPSTHDFWLYGVLAR